MTCLDPSGAQSAVRGMPVLFGNLGLPARLNSGRHVESYRKLDHSEALRLCPRRSTAATRADTQPRPTAASPCPPHKADAPTLRSTLAVADSQQVRCRPETPNALSTQPRPSRSSEADTPCTSCSCRAPAACASPPAWRPCPTWLERRANGSVRSSPYRRSPYPESTERRLWGQSLKKPEGAPLNLGEWF